MFGGSLQDALCFICVTYDKRKNYLVLLILKSLKTRKRIYMRNSTLIHLL